MNQELLKTGRKVKVMTGSKGLQNGVITGSVKGLQNETLVTVRIGTREISVSPDAIIK